ncbi:ATP-binding protein [Roseofilum sp. Guam]|uniref:ATP-binding protein n=1 Tax=Roseofilum sp. Guam TaxID=2821502 RepID=UPI001B2001B1|nr:ATP-binding protein [Roseofilum sp. Guam]MBP0028427.1 ATP-binding protein [Roseofilum sp. Guam]
MKLCEVLEIDWRIASGTGKTQTVLTTNCPNPFMQRGMLTELDEIYGRERELQQVFEFLNSGASVALIGGAGMGTSSLLCAVKQKATELLPERKPVYFNMCEILNLEEYYLAFADAVESNAIKPFQIQREIKQNRLLLLLDNIEQLQENWFNDGVRRQLRAWANQGQNSPIRLVVAAHRPLTELFEDSGFDSPFANICHELELQPWDKETIEGFITHRLAGTEVQFTAEEIAEIVTQSQGIPSEVVKQCYHCYETYRN